MAEEDLDRRMDQILNELRNTLLGVQILMAGLVAIPFSQRFATVGALPRTPT